MKIYGRAFVQIFLASEKRWRGRKCTACRCSDDQWLTLVNDDAYTKFLGGAMLVMDPIDSPPFGVGRPDWLGAGKYRRQFSSIINLSGGTIVKMVANSPFRIYDWHVPIIPVPGLGAYSVRQQLFGGVKYRYHA